LWTTKESYVDKGADYYEQRYQERVITRLKKEPNPLVWKWLNPLQSSLSFWRVNVSNGLTSQNKQPTTNNQQQITKNIYIHLR